MKSEKILVVGMGPVGLATAIGFAYNGLDVICYDIDSTKISLLQSGIAPFYEKDLQDYLDKYSGHLCFTNTVAEAFNSVRYCFIAVGTPIGQNGEADLAAFWKVIELVSNNLKNGIIIIKSTVPVGTNRKVKSYLAQKELADCIDVVSNPEFLAQGTSVLDTIEASRIVIGSSCDKSRNEVLKLYEKCLCEKILTNPESAEIIKYEANCYLAMRISFVNDLAVTCELVGADVQAVLRGVSFDPRIGKNYFSPGIGYGGSCFPKDTVAFHNQIQKEYGHELELIEATIDINKRQCLYLCRKIVGDFGDILGKKIAVLGVAFKKNTDDVRSSLAIDNINFLNANGAHITTWDPITERNCKYIFGDSIVYEESLKRAVSENDIILIMTDWDEIANMPMEWLRGKNVYDGKNLFLGRDTSGFEYTYIGGRRSARSKT